jgi:hypothetical protein
MQCEAISNTRHSHTRPGDRCPGRAVTQHTGLHLCWAHAKRAGWRPEKPRQQSPDAYWEPADPAMVERIEQRWDRIGACIARVT